jgi:hypothetical protein
MRWRYTSLLCHQHALVLWARAPKPRSRVLLFEGEMGLDGDREEWKARKRLISGLCQHASHTPSATRYSGTTPHASPCILTHRYAGTYVLSNLALFSWILKANLHLTVLSARCSTESAHRVCGHGDYSVFTHHRYRTFWSTILSQLPPESGLF